MAAGSSFVATVLNGASRVEPLLMSTQTAEVPTTVSAAGAGCAQPLAQPEMCILNEPSRCGAAAAAICGARARAAISADAQIGAPAQAITCRRGSSARATKPSATAAAANELAICCLRPTIM